MDNCKSKKILDGVYNANDQIEPLNGDEHVHEFVKQRGNFK